MEDDDKDMNDYGENVGVMMKVMIMINGSFHSLFSYSLLFGSSDKQQQVWW